MPRLSLISEYALPDRVLHFGKQGNIRGEGTNVCSRFNYST